MGSRKTRAQLRDEAYERLGVTPEQVAAVPPISYLLRRLDGRKNAAIAFLRGSANPDARRFLEVYDDAPVASRNRLPIEAFCIAANIPTPRLVGIVMEEAVRQGALCSILIAASNLPRIVKKTAEMALTDTGVQDRKMFLQATGFLPWPESSTAPTLSALPATRREALSQTTGLPLCPPARQLAIAGNSVGEEIHAGDEDATKTF